MAADVMNGLNGSVTPSTSSASEADTPRSLTPPTIDQRKSDRRSSKQTVSSRTSSYKSAKEKNQGHGHKKFPEISDLDGVGDEAVGVQADEELSPKSLPIRAPRAIDAEDGIQEREVNDAETLPLESHHHRSSTVVRALGSKDKASMPVLAMNDSKAKKENDRTPTNQGSFWGKE